MFYKPLRLLIVSLLFSPAPFQFAVAQQTPASSAKSAANLSGPVVDYESTAGGNNSVSSAISDNASKRYAKSARYNRPKSPPIKEDATSIPLPLTSHWWIGLPALPVDQSDLIVVGTVTEAHAYFSNDRAAVYSEFSIHVDQVLKDVSGTVATGTVIITTRYGGTVRFPDGNTQQYRIAKQSWPATGARYALFLRKNPSGDFDIVTGYEFRNSLTFPLDTGNEHALPFQKYFGTPEAIFLATLKQTSAPPSYNQPAL